jgi:hypothetical protein
MKITDLTKILETNSIFTTILLVISFLFISFLRSKVFTNFITKIGDIIMEKIMNKKIKDIGSNLKSISDSNLIHHDIFNYIDFWTHSKVPTFQFSTEYRTAVFRKYLTIYLKSHKKKLKDFIDSRSYETMDNPHLIKTLLDLVNQIVYDYEEEVRNARIPDIVIERMKIKNNDNISLILDLIEATCESRFYDSEKNYLKIYSILNIITSVLEHTINNSDTVCNSINGSLKGMKFEGKIEP